MWHRLKNFLSSLWTYNALRPDFRVRRRVNRSLSDRPALSQDEWFEAHYKAQGVTYAIALFAYQHLGQYSGLDLSRVLPSDRLEEDLQWTEVCWFDWEQSLCEDFHGCFGVDMGDRLDFSCLSTVQDLVDFLNQQKINPDSGELDFPEILSLNSEPEF
ncbi:MAG: hypothetical protein KME15_15260 [Drouetiella hepatica Uher 2000/2452]|jgi:hypothetical protein|uniref:Uncharacterized protein n=1 Tax=Drouetiella hepatica Uher 2000/2452 TaxID=904376 RepID=A0A951QC13_9CYAN|nr:hypothetical protein [Drouetiella hepatica Uher 2000/2452]